MGIEKLRVCPTGVCALRVGKGGDCAGEGLDVVPRAPQGFSQRPGVPSGEEGENHPLELSRIGVWGNLWGALVTLRAEKNLLRQSLV